MSTDREKAAKENPDSWIPVSEGEVLDGEMTDFNIGLDMNGKPYPIVTVADSQTGIELKVHGFATALHNEIYMKQPIPGERVQFIYLGLGEVKTKGQNAPERYRLRVFNRGADAYQRMYAMLSPKGQGFTIPPPNMRTPNELMAGDTANQT